MHQKVILIGRLGKDVEIRYTQSGDAVANFNLATSNVYKSKQTGEKVESVEWHKVVAFKRTAEICGEYLHKGSLIYVEGRLKTRDWEDKDGNKRWTTEIIIDIMKMLSSRKDSDTSSGEDPSIPDDIPDDDVPF